MRIYRHYDALPADARGAAVAIGNFDGVHPGHQTVIHEAGLIAGDMCRPWTVLTFEPHPRELFQPNQTPFRLTPLRSPGLPFSSTWNFGTINREMPFTPAGAPLILANTM